MANVIAKHCSGIFSSFCMYTVEPLYYGQIIVLVSEVSLFHGENNMYIYKVGTQSSVLIKQGVGENNTYLCI